MGFRIASVECDVDHSECTETVIPFLELVGLGNVGDAKNTTNVRQRPEIVKLIMWGSGSEQMSQNSPDHAVCVFVRMLLRFVMASRSQ